MANIVDFSDITYKVKDKIFKYIIFTIAIVWSPIVANYFLSFIFKLKYQSFLIYTSEICFMTIVLAANNLKDLSEGCVLKRGKILYNFLYALNIVNIIFSILFFAGFNSLDLSGAVNVSKTEWRQFWYAIGSYIVAATMGLSVQIGSGIDQIRRANRREKQ